jgi:predicted ATPase
MIFAISGTHGVGKTTLVDALSREYPDWKVRLEATRSLVPRLRYSSPYEIVRENGIAMYEAAMLAQWCVLSDASMHPNQSSVEIVDRSPIDNLAYYFVHRTFDEMKHEKFLMRLTSAYAAYIDLYIHVPRLPFMVPLDELQLIETQADIENTILELYDSLSVRYLSLHSTSIADRVRETVNIIVDYTKGVLPASRGLRLYG